MSFLEGIYPPVLTKRDFVDRYMEGEFGNASPTWNTLEELVASGWPLEGEAFHLRNRETAGHTFYNLGFDRLRDLWETINRVGDSVAKHLPAPLSTNGWYISAMAPTHKTLIQGEVSQRETGLYLYYSRIKRPMREALALAPEQAKGIVAKMTLESYLDANSMDWLNVLLERYPDHVVEFSTYSSKWGTIPGFNTVFWEVRRY